MTLGKRTKEQPTAMVADKDTLLEGHKAKRMRLEPIAPPIVNHAQQARTPSVALLRP